MFIKRILSVLILLTCASFTHYASADQCPVDTTKATQEGWSVYQGQITTNDKFSQAMLMSIMSNASCVYTNSFNTKLILMKSGSFKPLPADFWANCPTVSYAKCCMNSIETCTFVQTSLQTKKQ